jgi:Cof subfamily protein (haloacid dehalogenase superfamily)
MIGGAREVGAAGPIKLLLADVDGTLVTQEKELTAAAIAAAQDLRAAGISLAVTSGRPPRGMSMLVAPLGLTTPIAGFNGGEFVEPNFSVIESHLIDPAVAAEALELILDADLDAWVYTPDDWLVRCSSASHVAREAWTVGFTPKVVAEFTPDFLANTVKIVGVSDDFAKVATCEREAQERLARRASATRSQPYYLDVTHPLANKGEVVTWLARRLGLSPSQIATVGDMPNDVLMFAVSGYSIAMGQAADEVKARATTTTASNDAEGFAKAVEMLLAQDRGQ